MSYLIRANNGTILAYVDGTHFIEDNINILDASTNQVIANLYRDKFTLSAWTWIIKANLPSHPVGTHV